MIKANPVLLCLLNSCYKEVQLVCFTSLLGHFLSSGLRNLVLSLSLFFFFFFLGGGAVNFREVLLFHCSTFFVIAGRVLAFSGGQQGIQGKG